MIRFPTPLAAVCLLAASEALAQTGGGYDLTWSTVDGGGQMFSVSGDGVYVLGGTIGQCDAGPAAGPMTDVGNTYSLVGGFWPAAPCTCAADMNGDGNRNGLDVQGFLQCFVGGGFNCGCADLNHDGLLDSSDMTLFVSGLLETTPCP